MNIETALSVLCFGTIYGALIGISVASLYHIEKEQQRNKREKRRLFGRKNKIDTDIHEAVEALVTMIKDNK